MRRELGDAARALLDRRAYRRLGFVRLSDYTRERLGVSARTIQQAAWMARRLDELPVVAQAYDRSELSWSQARAICTVAVAEDAEGWLAIARRSTVARLDRLVSQARRTNDVPEDPDGAPNEIDGEPAVRWRFACPARVRVLWRRAIELASRASGERLAEWRAAEVIAAEGSSGRPAGASMGDRALIAALRSKGRAGRNPHAEDGTVASVRAAERHLPDDMAPAVDPTAPRGSVSEPAPTDPFALDARVAEAMRVLRTIEPKIGRLLQVIVDQRIHRAFGCARLDDYVHERLGISPRKAWALLKIETATRRSAEFADAYHDGALSWVRAVTLLPVLERTHGAAWVARAQAVTVRRLGDEVEWVLASRDAHGPDVLLAPPPVDSTLPSPIAALAPEPCRNSSLHDRLQIRAHADTAEHHVPDEICDAEISFIGPTSVVALLRDVLDAFADPWGPRWRALERMLRHVIGHWEGMPRHPDPVFARDGWRCTVPACSSRRNLHDHHITFRSRGGGNARDNRTTICAAHHLHGIHAGTIQAEGSAPHAIEWRLGVRPGGTPLFTCLGDRYWRPSTTSVASPGPRTYVSAP